MSLHTPITAGPVLAPLASLAPTVSLPPAPQINIPFLDAVRVIHGPPGLLGRLFLQADAYMRQRDLRLEFASFEEVVAVNGRNRDSWGQLNPMFDPRVADIPADRALCVVARKSCGTIVATASAKGWDARDRSFKDVVTDGDFFSFRPNPDGAPYTASIGALAATTLTGELAYVGGIWVHPEVRGMRLPALLLHILNGAALTLWDPAYLIGLVAPEVVGTELCKRYGYPNMEPSLTVTQSGVTVYEGVLLWATREDAHVDLARYLDTLRPEIDATIAA